MKYLFKYTLFILILSACKVDPKKTVGTSKNYEIAISPENKVATQHKDSTKTKSAIGKSYHKWLHEITEFKDYDSSGGWSIVEYDRNNSKYSSYGLKTVDIFEKNEKEGTSIRKGIKYIVMVNGKTVVDYIDIEKIKLPKGIILYGEGVQLNGEVDMELFAFAPYNEDEEEIITEVYKVYRADKETSKIIEISKDGITIIAEYM